MVPPSICRDTARAQRLTFHSDSVVSRRREGYYGSYRPLLNMQAICVVQVLWNGAKDSLRANAVKTTLQQFRWETVEHPQSSPELLPFDFHVFGPLKRAISGASVFN
ncbi:hypothetical protein TNCV_4062331 [Trichonephila clavipes]|nr:hypothetical protein TNCV_4062331 [Trichonephila clavipes]